MYKIVITVDALRYYQAKLKYAELTIPVFNITIWSTIAMCKGRYATIDYYLARWMKEFPVKKVVNKTKEVW
jgi:hypothetical protein